MRWKALLFWLIVLLIIAGLGFLVYRRLRQRPAMGPGQMPPPAVTVAHPQQQAVQDFQEFTGNTSAIEEVQIRARIKGTLQKVHFRDGTEVQKGQLLFEIEPESYLAARNQAQAMLQAAKAQRERAEEDYKRVQEAIQVNAVSEQELTAKKTALETAKASVLAAQAALDDAELNLSYTKIHSPIDGRIGRRMVDAGNLVGAGEQTLLATVVRLDPIYVYFDVSESLFLKTFGPKTVGPDSRHPIRIALENETEYPHKGVLNFMDNRLDEGTGTLILRGELGNSDQRILPGMYVRVQIPVGDEEPALLVHQRALGTDLDGKYLMLVNSENQVQRRPVTVGRQVESMQVVTEGLAKEDTYIVDGLQFVYSGATVQPEFEKEQTSDSGAALSSQPGAANDQ